MKAIKAACLVGAAFALLAGLACAWQGDWAKGAFFLVLASMNAENAFRGDKS